MQSKGLHGKTSENKIIMQKSDISIVMCNALNAVKMIVVGLTEKGLQL